jgi:hypothetical protein
MRRAFEDELGTDSVLRFIGALEAIFVKPD